MKYITIFFILFVFSHETYAQNQVDVAKRFAETITSQDLKAKVYFLAGDSCQGRETGTPGQKIAANYIARFFKSLGLPAIHNKGYFQSYPIQANPTTSLSIKTDGFIFDTSMFSYMNGFKDMNISYNEAVMAGYGIHTDKYNDYKTIKVKDKVVFIFHGEPIENGKSVIDKQFENTVWTNNFILKVSAAEKNGAKALFFVIPDSLYYRTVYNWFDIASEYDLETYYNPYHIPYFFIKSSVVSQLLKREINTKDLYFTQTLNLNFNIQTTKNTIYGENVLGYIEGSDLKDEILVITAHYDHLGMQRGKIYWGADDDGSGTSAVLEIAEAFVKAQQEGHGPRRSILIMPVSGEEKGLLGSSYYTNNPVFPLTQIIANLNIDMIGRIDEHHPDNYNYVYLIGSDKLSTDLHNISEQANATYTNLELDYKYNEPNDPNQFYYRSDHYNFAKHNIPVIFYFTGVHEDYHKPTDTPDKLNYEKTAKITQLVFYTAWELANRDLRPVVDKENDFKKKR